MSLYADYLLERTDDKIIELDNGFATYRYLNNDQVYIIDIYVKPNVRKIGMASELADLICTEAKSRGCKELIGTVNLTCKGIENSIKILLAYGMTPSSAYDNTIFFKKEL